MSDESMTESVWWKFANFYLSLERFYLNPDLWHYLSQPDLYEFQDDEGLEDEGSRRDCEDLM